MNIEETDDRKLAELLYAAIKADDSGWTFIDDLGDDGCVTIDGVLDLVVVARKLRELLKSDTSSAD